MPGWHTYGGGKEMAWIHDSLSIIMHIKYDVLKKQFSSLETVWHKKKKRRKPYHPTHINAIDIYWLRPKPCSHACREWNLLVRGVNGKTLAEFQSLWAAGQWNLFPDGDGKRSRSPEGQPSWAELGSLAQLYSPHGYVCLLSAKAARWTSRGFVNWPAAGLAGSI